MLTIPTFTFLQPRNEFKNNAGIKRTAEQRQYNAYTNVLIYQLFFK